MGGKGRRRREKNYRAVHGGPTRLPPPPDPSQIEALPSKLRKIMSFAPSLGKVSKDAQLTHSDAEKKRRPEKEIKSGAKDQKDDGDNGHPTTSQHTNSDGEITQNNANEKKKRKRKSKEATDLRFQTVEDILGSGSKRKERKKKYFEAKKKKHKKPKTEDELDFPGKENIKFGEVVEAPLKLVTVPKALKMKTAHDASKERLRVQAIEAYRNRKGWTSRPGGVKLLPPVTS